MRNIVAITLLLLAPCMAIYADTIELKSLEKGFEGKVIELGHDYIGVAISEKDVKSVTILPNAQQAYPDIVSLHTSDAKLECKVVSVSPDNIGIRIPKTEVLSIHVVFAPEATGKAEELKHREPEIRGQMAIPHLSPPLQGENKGGIEPKTQDTRLETQAINREAAKEKIKRDVVQELKASSPDLLSTMEKMPKEEDWPNPQVFKEEIKKELKEELDAKQEAEEKMFQETKLGRVEGRILRKGQPLSDCEVRILMLVKAKIPLTKSFYQPELPTEYEGITDSEGYYHFINVAPGEYKIYWKPPAESGWIRRLKVEPDIVVESGKTTYPKDIETFKRVIN